MGHSTNVLALRGGIVFKWNVFFISSHFVNYYSEYNYFFNLIKNYLYFVFKYRYKKFFRFFGIYFGFLRINITKLNTLNVSVFVYDHFFMKMFTKFFKQFAAFKFKYGLGSLSLRRKLNKSRKKKRKSVRLGHLKRLYAGFKDKEIKQNDELFSNTFENQLDESGLFSSSNYNFNRYSKGYDVANQKIKNYKFTFFNSRFFNLEGGFRYFLLNGFFYPRYVFFRRKDIIKYLSVNRFFFNFHWKMKQLDKIKDKLLVKKGKNYKYVKKNTKKLIHASKTSREYYFKLFIFFFEKYKRHKEYWRIKNYSYKRVKTTLKLFKLVFIRNFNRFFFTNFIKFSIKNKKITFNSKFLFVIMYLSYQTRFRKIRFRKKNRKLFKNVKGRYIRFTRILPGMMKNLFLFASEDKERFIKLLHYFYIILRIWFWLLLINNLLKRLFSYFYKTFREIIYFKLIYFFSKKEDLFKKKMFDLNNINIYPLAAKTLPLDLVLRFFDWKMKRYFTINQTVWPFLKKVKKTNRFIRGFFLVGSGRFTKKQRADIKKYKYGKVRLGSYNYRLNHAFSTITTRYGLCGLKFWINISKRHTNHKYNKIHKIVLI